MTCDPPNNGIYSYSGTLTRKGMEEDVLALEPRNLMLRGSSLRNTMSVIGLVVYTGRPIIYQNDMCEMSI